MEETEPFVLLPFHGVHQRAVSAVTFAPTSSLLLASSFTSNHSTSNNHNNSCTLAASASADGTVRTWEITGDMLDAAPKYSSTQQTETNSGLSSSPSPDVQIVDSTPDDVTNGHQAANESKTDAASPNTNTNTHNTIHMNANMNSPHLWCTACQTPGLKPLRFLSSICFSICFRGPRRQPNIRWIMLGSCWVDVTRNSLGISNTYKKQWF